MVNDGACPSMMVAAANPNNPAPNTEPVATGFLPHCQAGDRRMLRNLLRHTAEEKSF